MRWWIAVAWLSACSDPPSPIGDAIELMDAPRGVRYEIGTGPREPRLDPRPTIVIDGLAVDHVVAFYSTQEQFEAATHVVELRSGEVVLDRFTIDPAWRSMTGCQGQWAYVRDGFCVYDHGEVRFSSSSYGKTNGASECIADGFCTPRCFCAADEHCTARITLAEPLYTKVACAPVGTKSLGQTCMRIADPAGAYDDCGRGLLCLDGTCRAMCTGPQCGACPAPPRYPDEIRVCP